MRALSSPLRMFRILLGLIGMLAIALPATASPPIHEVNQFADAALIEDCGLTLSWQTAGEEKLTVFTRGPDGLAYFALHVDGSQSWTNVDTGKTMTLAFAFRDRDHEVVDNGDGTLTITVLSTVNTTVASDDGAVVRRQAGSNVWHLLVDHNGTPEDPFDDEFITDLGFLREHSGLNQFASSDFCEDLQTFTG